MVGSSRERSTGFLRRRVMEATGASITLLTPRVEPAAKCLAVEAPSETVGGDTDDVGAGWHEREPVAGPAADGWRRGVVCTR